MIFIVADIFPKLLLLSTRGTSKHHNKWIITMTAASFQCVFGFLFFVAGWLSYD